MTDKKNTTKKNTTRKQKKRSVSGQTATRKNASDQTAGGQAASNVTLDALCPTPQPRNIPVNSLRRGRARGLRRGVAQIAFELPHPMHPTNGEEPDSVTGGDYPNYPYQANYSKGLPKIIIVGGTAPNERSDVDPTAYQTYRDILEQARQGNFPDFSAIPLGGDGAKYPQPPNCDTTTGPRLQTNPQSGVAFDLEGPDAFAVNLLSFGTNPTGGLGSLRPAPRIDGEDGDGKPQNDRENAAEMIELYWMALVRDLHFKEFKSGGRLNAPPGGWGETAVGGGDTLIDKAVKDLNRPVVANGKAIWRHFDDVTPYPTENVSGIARVTHNTIFRGSAFGDNVGPFISQFLLRGMTVRCNRSQAIRHFPEDGVVPHGTVTLFQRQQTVQPYVDFLRDVGSWRCVEQGSDDPTGTDPFECAEDNEKGRFIRNLRDLANWVHVDYLYQHFLNAALIMLNEPPLEPQPGTKSGPTVQRRTLDSFNAAMPMRPFALDPGLPYSPLKPDAQNQAGFVTFGPIHILTLLAEVVSRALKAAWFQKWYVHRRNRPEEFGGLVHFQKMAEKGTSSTPPVPRPQGPYPCLDPLILDSDDLLNLIFSRNNIADALPGGQTVTGGNTYLLPQIFPEGSPTHPAYPSGHATAAGACVTILKALFDESRVMTDPTNVVPTNPTMLPAAFIAADDGLSLEKAPNQNAGDLPLTVEGELNKMVSNIAIGRDAAGVHWRSDATEGMKLGEAVAAQLLLEQSFTFHEKHEFSFNTLFSNRRVRYNRERSLQNGQPVEDRVTVNIGDVSREPGSDRQVVQNEMLIFEEEIPLNQS